MMKDSTIKNLYFGWMHSIILKEDGSVWVFGDNKYSQLGIGNNENQNKPVLLIKDEQIKTISCGSDHSFIYKENGELWTFGNNSDGQLGIGNKEDQNKPVLLMKENSISVILSGKVRKEWSFKKHNSFPLSFQKRILLFVLILKRIQTKTGLKIPKFILFEIIKKAV